MFCFHTEEIEINTFSWLAKSLQIQGTFSRNINFPKVNFLEFFSETFAIIQCTKNDY